MAKRSSILLNFLNFSAKKSTDIIENCPDLDLILSASGSELKNILSLNSNDIEKILSFRNSAAFEDELRLIDKNKVKCLDIFDPDYPTLLKEIACPPLVLYVKGSLDIFSKFLFAIVGSRIPTMYGISMAKDYAHRLSSLGIGVVSGLARGIDAAAHIGAIDTGQTIAVLGSGLLNIYPRDNRKLFDRIIGAGAVISEFPLKTLPLKENFPRRNRIVSGLSRGVLVVEAAIKSGALITARLACEQNRDVFAIPGNADSPLSKGTHSLIKEGAKLVDCLEDILEELNVTFDEPKKADEFFIKLEEDEEEVFKAIEAKEGLTFEEIANKCSLEYSPMAKAVLNLQLKGVIREVRPRCFIRTK